MYSDLPFSLITEWRRTSGTFSVQEYVDCICYWLSLNCSLWYWSKFVPVGDWAREGRVEGNVFEHLVRIKCRNAMHIIVRELLYHLIPFISRNDVCSCFSYTEFVDLEKILRPYMHWKWKLLCLHLVILLKIHCKLVVLILHFN